LDCVAGLGFPHAEREVYDTVDCLAATARMFGMNRPMANHDRPNDRPSEGALCQSAAARQTKLNTLPRSSHGLHGRLVRALKHQMHSHVFHS
jgi:hypothetical protein